MQHVSKLTYRIVTAVLFMSGSFSVIILYLKGPYSVGLVVLHSINVTKDVIYQTIIPTSHLSDIITSYLKRENITWMS
jgi:hypothetical protein